MSRPLVVTVLLLSFTDMNAKEGQSLELESDVGFPNEEIPQEHPRARMDPEERRRIFLERGLPLLVGGEGPPSMLDEALMARSLLNRMDR